jgi:hypothetical protein
MKIGDLIRWNRGDYNESLSLPWFEKQGIVLEVDGAPVVTVMWSTELLEKIFADDLEVISEAR